jgi:hypothetical protein
LQGQGYAHGPTGSSDCEPGRHSVACGGRAHGQPGARTHIPREKDCETIRGAFAYEAFRRAIFPWLRDRLDRPVIVPGQQRNWWNMGRTVDPKITERVYRRSVERAKPLR